MGLEPLLADSGQKAWANTEIKITIHYQIHKYKSGMCLDCGRSCSNQ